MNKPDVAKHLKDKEYQILLTAYQKHNASMGFEKRQKYDFSNIVKVESHPEQNCLHVHYKDGEWWHYTPQGTWY
ncbi:hypothetical protein J2S78_000146 [Salibacterium salarium]|uniref:hypothetical protein n=1 Tax=Salibacterium salarium TaxID=284579 RepID=UPI00278A81D9|nr:hypothetical protein [Salibacterium salarium]MDQ0297738.1 hypothetical protein [Salibacterium salarium]